MFAFAGERARPANSNRTRSADPHAVAGRVKRPATGAERMPVSGIYARESSTLGRPVQVGVVSGKVIDVSFPDSLPADAESDHEHLDAVLAAIDRGETDLSSVPIGLTVPTDQRSVLESLRNVPRGDTVDVALLVRMAGLDPEDDDSERVVREALAANPVPVVVPDHRVKDGPSAAPDDVVEALRKSEGI
ncbi:methylated-DNA--protein-cysteine methyltransferase [Haloferax denitrificans ATCC 35960]|uniref:Methylated-DNA--protein-cysteine methyltransferase n=2 Tax=Haloferax denitrificans TaxID=35745 RepID=M0IXP7_9EURY|nr:methylated-DNA--protein-cysteine methyltransferase [Haloferax denitrificans ATCC 35960]